MLHILKKLKKSQSPWCSIFGKFENLRAPGILCVEQVERISRSLVFYILMKLVDSRCPCALYFDEDQGILEPLVFYFWNKLKECRGYRVLYFEVLQKIMGHCYFIC